MAVNNFWKNNFRSVSFDKEIVFCEMLESSNCKTVTDNFLLKSVARITYAKIPCRRLKYPPKTP